VVIGGIAGVHQFVKIGRNAMVGGMAKVVQDIPPYVIADGQPAHVIGLNSVGLARAGVSEEVRQRNDVIITPKKGGVGPLTVSALFDNVITACLKIANQSKS